MILNEIKNFQKKASVMVKEYTILIHILVFIFGFVLMIESYKIIQPTFIAFRTFNIILIVSLIISVLLTIFDIRMNSIVKKFLLIKPAETYLYFCTIMCIFFSINYYISFKTSKVYDNYEVYDREVIYNILGQTVYKFWIAEDTWHDWASSGWIIVDSAKFYHTRDYISIRIDRGILGFDVIPKNQIK
jgi:hypothetical protein